MENKNTHQIIITTNHTTKKQQIPFNLWISLAAGAITGVAVIFGLIMGLELLLGV